MNDELQTYQWKDTSPHAFVAVQVIFAPTRSWIKGYKEASKITGATTSMEDMVFLMTLKQSGSEGVTVVVEFDFVGEPLQVLAVDWLTVLQFEPTKPNHFSEIFRGRNIVAKGDAKQRFFFDLDRLTHEKFMQYSPELSDGDVLANRLALVRRLGLQLGGRLRQRLETVETRSIDPCDLLVVTGIFAEAASWLRDANPPIGVGDALLDFAAGDLARPIPFFVNGVQHDYLVSEPDSAAIFLFSEFALAARAVAPQFWTLSLILSLVKMQRYFLERFIGRGTLDWYRRPPAKLDGCKREVIDAEYKRVGECGLTVERIEELIQDNLARTKEKPSKPPARSGNGV